MRRVAIVGLVVFISLTTAGFVAQAPTRWELLGSVAAAVAIALWTRSPLTTTALVGAAAVVASIDGRLPVPILLAAAATIGVVAYTANLRTTAVALAIVLTSLVLAIALDNQVGAADGAQSILLVCVVAAGAAGIKRSLARTIELERLRTDLGLSRARSELARDVHDVTSHALMAVLTQLRVGRRGIEQSDAAVAARGIDQAEAAARSAIGDLRALTLLVAEGERPLASCQSIREINDQIAQSCANFTPTEFEHDDADGPVASNVATTAIRVVQQCLANAAAHAPGNCLTVRSKVTGKWLMISAQNQASVSGEPGLQLGLTIMQQRVAEVGGTLEAGKSNGVFHVECRLPIGTST
jgi:signal transduction histidine kinase